MDNLEEEFLSLKKETAYLTNKLNSFEIKDDASLVEGLKMLLRANEIKERLLTLLDLMKDITDE